MYQYVHLRFLVFPSGVPVCLLQSFSFCLKNSFQSFFFFQPVLMMHSLSFCLIEKVFILPFLLEGIFTGNRILGCKLFSFLFIPWSFAIIISVDKSVINLMVVPLKVYCWVVFFPKCFEDASLCFSLVSFLNVFLSCTL